MDLGKSVTIAHNKMIKRKHSFHLNALWWLKSNIAIFRFLSKTMESEDDKKLFHEEREYRVWLQSEHFKQDKHVCFDIPATKEGNDWFDFQDKLMQAAMYGCKECLDKLIKAGADVNKTGQHRITALMWVSRYGHPDCVNALLAGGADLYMTDEFGSTALSHPVDRSNGIERWLIGQQRDCLKILLRAIGSNVDSSPLETETPVICVADFGENTWLKSLIEAGADVNRADMLGRTALMGAIYNKHNDCTLTLLRAGADVNIVDKRKNTALKYAA